MLKAWILSYGIANRVNSPLQLPEETLRIHRLAFPIPTHPEQERTMIVGFPYDQRNQLENLEGSINLVDFQIFKLVSLIVRKTDNHCSFLFRMGGYGKS